MLHKPEYRLKARSRQDRSVTRRNARTTDKGLKNSGIYSLLSRNNMMKRELTQGLMDEYAPASHFVFWNTKFVKLYSHKDRKFPGQYVDFRRFFDQDAEIATIQWAGALVCSAPRMQAALTALTA